MLAFVLAILKFGIVHSRLIEWAAFVRCMAVFQFVVIWDKLLAVRKTIPFTFQKLCQSFY